MLTKCKWFAVISEVITDQLCKESLSGLHVNHFTALLTVTLQRHCFAANNYR